MMKVAIGIIGIFFSLVAMLQSCAIMVFGGGDDLTSAGALGLLAALLMFFGSAFAFQLPKVAENLFILSMIIAWLASDEFPDALFWSFVSAGLAALSWIARRTQKSDSTSPPPAP